MVNIYPQYLYTHVHASHISLITTNNSPTYQTPRTQYKFIYYILHDQDINFYKYDKVFDYKEKFL